MASVQKQCDVYKLLVLLHIPIAMSLPSVAVITLSSLANATIG